MKTSLLLLAVLLFSSLTAVAEKPVDFFIREVERVAERYEKGSPAAAKEVESAVYPLRHSPKVRMNGTLADWDDVPFTGRLLYQSDNERLPLPPGLSAWFKAAVSDDTLYLLAVAEDRQVTFARNATAYNNDCFELFLDPLFRRAEQCDDTTIQLFVTAADPEGKVFTAQGKIPARAVAVPVPGGWGVEIAVPLRNDCFEATVSNGLPFGFNLCYNNNDGAKSRQHKLSWSGLDRADRSWSTPTVYGVLETVSEAKREPVPAAEGRLVAEKRKLRRSGETLADPTVLARFRPLPEVVRGFMMGNFRDGDAEAAAAWGANAVRLQYSPAKYLREKGSWDGLLDRMEEQVKTAEKHGLKVIIDVHSAPVTGKGSIWRNPDLEKNFLALWREIAVRLKPYGKTIWGYDLYNEPVDRAQLPYAPPDWRPLAVKIIRAIREIDREVWIVYEVGPGGGSRGFEDLLPLPDERVIYSCHFYNPGTFTHQGIAATQLQDPALMAQAQESSGIAYPGLIGGTEWNKEKLEKSLSAVIDFQAKYQVPIYIGEFSVIAWAPKESAVRYLEDVISIFEKYNWSWTYHAFREYQGWSLEHEDGVLRPGGKLRPVKDSARGAVVRTYLKKNTP